MSQTLRQGEATRKADFGVKSLRDHKILWILSPGNGGWTKLRRLRISVRMNIGTWLFTRLNGRRIGTDGAGNIYFEDRKVRPGQRTRRWVAYAGAVDASEVPPEWHAWLHYTTDAPLPDTGRKPWQKPHLANATGTPLGYRPPGHDYQGGQRARATGDYEAWTPGS
jgi:NADH:ubiquinone oxidoreductase subunit